MRFRSVVLVAVMLMAPPVFAAPADPHIRTLDPHLSKIIRDGVAGSRTFARIVDGLEGSDVVVYVGFNPQLPASLGGRTTLMTSSGKWRYVRIVICPRLTDFQRIVMLAHELHHALEISSSPEVRDRQSLRALYRVIGEPALCPSECFETASAIDAENDVERELRRSVSKRNAPAGVAHSSHDRGDFVATEE